MTAWRMQFLTTAVIILIGIWLTGFDRVHWFLYIPVAALAIAAFTGKCMGLEMWKRLGFKE